MLRDRLRADTRADHDATDRAFSGFDLTAEPDIRAFLAAQRLAFATIRRAGTPDPATAAVIGDLLARLDADLGDGPAPDPVPPAFDAAAIAYVTHGSRLGARILRSRWARGTDPAARALRHYFDAPADPAPWRALCADLSGRRPTGVRADRIVADTRRLFVLFRTAAVYPGRAPETAHV